LLDTISAYDISLAGDSSAADKITAMDQTAVASENVAELKMATAENRRVRRSLLMELYKSTGDVKVVSIIPQLENFLDDKFSGKVSEPFLR
jgi:hypothetical protein